MARSSVKKPAPKSAHQVPQPAWADVLRTAQTRFHIKRFRPGQREVLESIFRQQNTLAIMPTGAGKSLTYQLPALFLPHPVVVVSPLIALMQDQQQKAEGAGIAVEKLDSTIRKSEADKAEREINEGIAQLIYVTPERLETHEFQRSLLAAGGISLLVVDEAHTIAQWGNDFRPAFKCIGEARKTLGNPPVLALTATATEEVVQEILHSLRAEDATIINTGTERENLFFSVHPTVSNPAKLSRILAMLEHEDGTGIIYTASVRSADELFDFLTGHEISVAHYHGRMPAKERARVQQEFMRGDHKVMIATKAFGLGIDKPDIRFVYHFEFPDSVETYYQEAGRAGRDGKPAHAVLLYRLEDKRIQSFFLAGRYPKITELQQLYVALTKAPDPDEQNATRTAANLALLADLGKRKTEVMLNLLVEIGLVRREGKGFVLVSNAPVRDKALAEILQTYTDRATSDTHRLSDIMHYAETCNCRTQIFRAYFSDPEGEPCLRCDNCAKQHPDDLPENVRKFLIPERDPQPASGTTKERAKMVTAVETKHGTIHTTAPETLPAPSADPEFLLGADVLHETFGRGKVVGYKSDVIRADFLKAGKKRLRPEFLQPA